MNIKSIISEYLSEIGRRGGSVKSLRKAEAVRRNGAKGGRPSKQRAKPALVARKKVSENR